MQNLMISYWQQMLINNKTISNMAFPWGGQEQCEIHKIKIHSKYEK